MTIYIWTPRIGLFQMIKDEEEIDYYKPKIEYINRDEPAVRHEIPHYASSTSDWKYVPMQEVRNLCLSKDTQKPNFVEIATKKFHISELRS